MLETMHRCCVAAFIFASCAVAAHAQIYSSILDLGHTADLIAFGVVDQATEVQSAVSPDTTLTVHLHLSDILKGQSASQNVEAALEERCAAGGSGRAPLCISSPATMRGLTGLWFFQQTSDGYRILPLHQSANRASELLLPVSEPSHKIPAGSDLDETLLSLHVQWMESLLSEPRVTFQDEQFFTAFEPWHTPRPAAQRIMTLIAPLLTAPAGWRHTVGLVIGLRAGSAEALDQVVRELGTLRSDSRLREIVDAIGQYPPGGGPGSKSTDWIEPLQRLLAAGSDIPGMEAAVAGSLYRIGSLETWPPIIGLLDAEDPVAQMIAIRTIALRLPAQSVTDETRKFSPGMPGPPVTTAQCAEFWKAWWQQNRAALGFPATQ